MTSSKYSQTHGRACRDERRPGLQCVVNEDFGFATIVTEDQYRDRHGPALSGLTNRVAGVE
jgi:hypothetical protein